MIRTNQAQSVSDRQSPLPENVTRWREALQADRYGTATVLNNTVNVAAMVRESGKSADDLTDADAVAHSAARGHQKSTADLTLSRLHQYQYWARTGLTLKGSRESIRGTLDAYQEWLTKGATAKHRTLRKKRSVGTAQTYANGILWLANDAGVHPLRITPGDVDRYMARESQKTGRPLTQNVKNRMIIALVLFAEFAGIPDPTEHIEHVQGNVDYTGKAIETDALEFLMDDADETEYTVYGLGSFAGLRACEIGRLRHENIVPIRRGGRKDGKIMGAIVYVWDGKFSRNREIPIDADAANNLHMFGLWDPEAKGPIFPFGELSKEKAGARVSKIVYKHGKRLGVERAHAHALRHWFAVRSYEAGADVVSIQRWLGHVKLTTTQAYLVSLASHAPIGLAGMLKTKRRTKAKPVAVPAVKAPAARKATAVRNRSAVAA